MRLCLLFLLTIALSGCSQKEPLYNTQTYVFGTLVDITIYGEPESRAHKLSNEIANRFQTLHQRLHAWQPSEITAINHAFANGEKVTISNDLAKIIQQATAFFNASNGKFNPAIGKLVQQWGFHQNKFSPQTIEDTEIRALVNAAPKMTDIVIENGVVHSQNPNVQLDLGGYAKGYALDDALHYLQSQNVENALINIGGNIIALGARGGTPWRVGIQHPRQPNAIATLNLPNGWAIGTSGDYQRYFMHNNKRYCHIINPATGYPADSIQAVTVLIPPQDHAGILSDVASKPIFIAPVHTRVQTAKDMGIDHYLIIESGQKLQVSPTMMTRLMWLDADAVKNTVTTQP